MDDISLGLLLGILVVLLLLSAFFSGSETAMMAINRYRLRHLVKNNHKGAKRTQKLLDRPDRLIGVVLLGNNFVNIAATAVATLAAVRLWGGAGAAIAPLIMTPLVLVFGEVLPKTLAANHPERLAFWSSLILKPLLRVLYPIVWLVSLIVNALLRPFVPHQRPDQGIGLSRDELRTVVSDSAPLVGDSYHSMLHAILDLEDMVVEDVMVPRQEIEYVDLEDDWDTILGQLVTCPHTRLPVCEGSLDQVRGLLSLRRIMPLLPDVNFHREQMLEHLQEPYYVPEGASLTQQLLNFQESREHLALVVDEYGDTHGLLTVEDLVEEIIGEFAKRTHTGAPYIYAQDDGSYLVDGSITMRELNRRMSLELPVEGPKTLNGAILEYLEDIPAPGTSIRLAGYPIEIVRTAGNAVKTARIRPAARVLEQVEE